MVFNTMITDDFIREIKFFLVAGGTTCMYCNCGAVMLLYRLKDLNMTYKKSFEIIFL